MVPYLLDCKRQFIVFFHHFVRLMIKGVFHFLFLYLVKRYYRWRSVFSWLRSFFAFYPLQHHAHIRHRRVHGKQKATVVVKHHCQGCLLNAKRASAQKYLSGLGILRSSAAYNRMNTIAETNVIRVCFLRTPSWSPFRDFGCKRHLTHDWIICLILALPRIF